MITFHPFSLIPCDLCILFLALDWLCFSSAAAQPAHPLPASHQLLHLSARWVPVSTGFGPNWIQPLTWTLDNLMFEEIRHEMNYGEWTSYDFLPTTVTFLNDFIPCLESGLLTLKCMWAV